MPRPLPPASRPPHVTVPDGRGRRDFLRALLAAGATGAAAALASPAAALGALARRAPAPLRVAVVVPRTLAPALASRAAQALLGARLGVEEAARAAALFGAPAPLLLEGDDVDALVRDGGARLLLGGWDDATAGALATAADRLAVPLLNVGAESDALRDATLHPWCLHVAASATMLRRARMAARAGDGTVVSWHESLEKFGAAQLNARFRARFGRAMDGDAWCGWAAAKAAGEAALRGRSTEPQALRAALLSPALRFDGQKGRPLGFDAHDRQLRQPLYLVRTLDGGREEASEIDDAAEDGR